MQSLGHACIFCTSSPRGHTSLFASYVLSGNSLFFGILFLNIFSTFPNPLSRIPYSAFHCNNSSAAPSFVFPSLQSGYNPFLRSSNMQLNFNFSLSLSHPLCSSTMTRRSSSSGSCDAFSSPSCSSFSCSSFCPPLYHCIQAGTQDIYHHPHLLHSLPS